MSRRRTFARALLVAACALLLGTGARALDDATNDAAALRERYRGAPSTWPRPELLPGAVFAEFGPVPDSPALDPAQVALGERLFQEPRLSGSRQIACASCHAPEMGFSDGLPVAVGHDRQKGTRNAPPLFTTAWTRELFWDGRAPSLEAQALEPLTNPREMAATPAVIEAWINTEDSYRTAFAPWVGARRIDVHDIAHALAVYQRSLRPPRNRWDRVFSQGIDALDDQQLLGLHLFRTKAGCANCHSGPLLTDQRFHNLGLGRIGTPRQDLGRYALSHDPADIGAFRTPSLRGLIHTRPYMHDGSMPFLVPVVLLYAGGGGVAEVPASGSLPASKRSPLLHDRALRAEERAALVAFLETL